VISRCLIGLLTLVCVAPSDPECREWNPGPGASILRPIAGPTKLCVGRLLQARWGNRWWDGQVKRTRPDGRIDFTRVGWDESVERSRIQLA
jgi:hypothetical protein